MNYRIKFLKVKLKSLAAEARIIRKEELKARGNDELREQLYLHRVNDVRQESRATHLAYGYLRGQALKEIEPTTREEGYWKDYGPAGTWNRVKTMVTKYGDVDLVKKLEEWR